jgi:serine/threonine-protein kinase HipA
VTTVAEVRLWGTRIGAVSLETSQTFARFQYDRRFAASGVEVSPLVMPLDVAPYTFPNLPAQSFHGLPGMLADSLPDRFGNALINAWLARQGRRPEDFNPVERLCYVGQRGVGALEYHPVTGPSPARGRTIEVEALVELASEILTRRQRLNGSFLDDGLKEEALRDILRVGTSAGGARAKALIAWNSRTNEVRSGQVEAGEGFEYWLLKFDGVAGNRDKEMEDPAGYGRIEYAYHLMARAAGIDMMPSRLMEENGRAHFMTRRFDRTDKGEKIHAQSLAALAHYDFNLAGAYSYEQTLAVIRRLGMEIDSVEEQYRRMVFNIIARNQDDHVKNIAFLMDKKGRWTLSPAFDVTHSYNPNGEWTATHQMTANGKREGFARADLLAVARTATLQRSRADHIIDTTRAAVARWPEFAERAGVPDAVMRRIAADHRTDV